jgi:glucosamine--fructose-6-phosphate aminotransferase (isomerizing)
VGVSQSGRSPDILAVLEEGRRQGHTTLAITNKPESPLAEVADYIIDIQAPEKAVAATVSYTSQLQAIAMLSAALAGDDERMAAIEQLPEWIDTVLKMDEEIATIALRYRYMNQCVVLGRGFNYSTAFEWALKMKEMAYVVADPYSSADFRHGPVALVERGFPVMAVAPQGAVFEDMLEMIEKLVEGHRAELMVISNQPEALDLATSPVEIPRAAPEWLSPVVSIVPAQLFSYHLTHYKGYDTETPRGLSKVTLTE